ncbi:MAG: sulfurtransferase TusA family protein [Nitrososphaerales archaeon]
MKVDFCEFPDELYYDVRNDVWFRATQNGLGTFGISTILSFLAGKLQKFNLRQDQVEVKAGQTVATLESGKYFGPVKAPVSGRIVSFNEELPRNPTLANHDPYGSGWVAQFDSFNPGDLSSLLKGNLAEQAIRARIKELKIRCFKELPDDDMFFIGTECSTTLANLNQLLDKRPVGTVVHLVTDDPMSEIEMIRWSDQTKNYVLETRKEENLFHFVIKKK